MEKIFELTLKAQFLQKMSIFSAMKYILIFMHSHQNKWSVDWVLSCVGIWEVPHLGIKILKKRFKKQFSFSDPSPPPHPPKCYGINAKLLVKLSKLSF